MKKQKKFQQKIKMNRKTLVKDHKFKASTISMWISGDRIPNWDNAIRLATLLNINISEIPYYRIERTL